MTGIARLTGARQALVRGDPRGRCRKRAAKRTARIEGGQNTERGVNEGRYLVRSISPRSAVEVGGSLWLAPHRVCLWASEAPRPADVRRDVVT